MSKRERERDDNCFTKIF